MNSFCAKRSGGEVFKQDVGGGRGGNQDIHCKGSILKIVGHTEIQNIVGKAGTDRIGGTAGPMLKEKKGTKGGWCPVL